MGAYMQNVADIPGNNIVTVLTDGVHRTWPTKPSLDTTVNTVQWIGGRASKVTIPVDYDGVPPMEFSSGAFVFRPSLDGKIMTAIDIPCIHPQGATPDLNSRWASDVNNDGLLDVVSTNLSSPNYWFAVMLSGAQYGHGCERTVIFPNVYPKSQQPSPLRDSRPMRMMRCADGKVRIIYVGTIHWLRTGIYLLDVNVQQTDTGYAVSYTMADSIDWPYLHFDGETDPWIIQPVICVDDARNGHQYALVNWQDGYHRNHSTTVMYEVSNGKLVERISTNGIILTLGSQTFDNAFDDGEAIIGYGGGPTNQAAYQFARINEFYRPFATLKPGTTGSGMVFIDDQLNDGSRDLFMASSTSITLINFDLSPTGVNEGKTQWPSWVQLEAGFLRLHLEHPTSLTVDVVNAVGQKQLLLSGFQALAGPSVIDIAAQLQALPKGAWFICVHDGVRIASLSYLR